MKTATDDIRLTLEEGTSELLQRMKTQHSTDHLRTAVADLERRMLMH